eukprot:4131167-Pleurochrysis_carterae.AAC.1
MNPPLRRNCAANVRKIVSSSYLGSSETGTQSSRVSAGSGSPISGTWHRRTFHPGSVVKPVVGGTCRILAAVSP